jgi:hypothetical protein
MEPVFTEIDQITNLDVMGRGNRLLYWAARGSTPLCLRAAKLIRDSIEKGGTVILTSGFPVIPNRRPETDGPPGAAVLAMAVKTLGATPVFVTDELSLNVHAALAKEVGLKGVEIKTVPVDFVKARETCRSILREHDPSLLIAVERPGGNKAGIYRNMRGEDISSLVGKVDPMFVDAARRRIPTIGIGDGGNEIGMGNVFRAVERYIPRGRSIASRTRVRSLVVSAVSNWGAYGVVAALSIITGRQLMHDAGLERRMIETCVRSGAVDGVTKRVEYGVDGLPSGFHERVVWVLRFMVDRALEEAE